MIKENIFFMSLLKRLAMGDVLAVAYKIQAENRALKKSK